jgi:hypothetical protein
MNAEQYLERIENKRLNSTPLYSRTEMIDFAENYVKQLTIPVFSQQRKLFYNFITWYNAKPNKNKDKMIYTNTIEEYLKL